MEKINEPQIVEYEIKSNGMVALVRYFPEYMGVNSYEELVKELKLFNETFWGNSEVDWSDCFDTNKDGEEIIDRFFLSCEYIKPIGKIAERINNFSNEDFEAEKDCNEIEDDWKEQVLNFQYGETENGN